MSTNVKVSSSWFKVVPLSAVVLLVGLILAFLFNNPPTIVQPASMAQPVGSGLERGQIADAARWNGLAQQYAAASAAIASPERRQITEAARLTGLAENFAGRMAASKTWIEAVKSTQPTVQAWKYANDTASVAAHHARIQSAESARLDGMAKKYLAQ
jgi:hypothetical protein